MTAEHFWSSSREGYGHATKAREPNQDNSKEKLKAATVRCNDWLHLAAFWGSAHSGTRHSFRVGESVPRRVEK